MGGWWIPVANIFERVRKGAMAGLKAFREIYMSGGAIDFETFGNYDARKLRYDVLWAFYENTAYRNIHKWAQSYRNQYGLYKWIRNLYNPAYRIGEFWKTHLMGGDLLLDEGMAKDFTALPVVLGEKADKKLFEAIRQIWVDSNWGIRKSIYTLWGPVYGDVALKIVDDVGKGKVFIDVVNPSTIKALDLDAFGNVKGYILEESREDPRKSGNMVRYNEIAFRDGDKVKFQTTLNGKLFAWNDDVAEWTVDYGFVPMVAVQHNNVGLDWGWSELHAGRSKIHELDDVASNFGDHVRKATNMPKLFTGVKKSGDIQISGGDVDETTGRQEPRREEVSALYVGNPEAQAHSLLEELNYEGVMLLINSLQAELRVEFPELQVDVWSMDAKETSGKAMRIARQRTTSKANRVRVPYDIGLIKAQQMAISIAGHRDIEGYDGFDLDSFGKGELDHKFGKRPTFDSDPIDDLELDAKFWANAKVANTNGVSLPIYLKRNGWTDKEIDEVIKSPDYQARLAGFARFAEENEDQDEG
jgi:hypothetical protein